jgi:hypothetical protein
LTGSVARRTGPISVIQHHEVVLPAAR